MKSASKQVASLSASALLKASEQECIACSISAIRDASEALRGATPRRATLRFRSIVTPSCSRRSTPRIPSSGPPHALAIAVRSIAGSLTPRRLWLPNVSSLIETSRACNAVVSFHDWTCTSFMRPIVNDFSLSMEVAAVSIRKRLSALSTWRIATGSRSQRCRGISVPLVEVCAPAPLAASSTVKLAKKQPSKPGAIRIIPSIAVLWLGRFVPKSQCWPHGKHLDRETGASSNWLPWRAPEFRTPTGEHPLPFGFRRRTARRALPVPDFPAISSSVPRSDHERARADRRIQAMQQKRSSLRGKPSPCRTAANSRKAPADARVHGAQMPGGPRSRRRYRELHQLRHTANLPW